jgi:dihydroorotate dehydrogenase electron transfer subunit
MGKFKGTAVVLSQKEISAGIFDLCIAAPSISAAARAGQFLNLYLNDRSRLLPRPVSICEILWDRKALRLVYRVTGEKAGTGELSTYLPGTEIEVLGPLGNGFPTDRKEIGDCIARSHEAEEAGSLKTENADSVIAVVGGGIGIPPLLELCHELPGKKTAVLGYRNADLFLKGDFTRAADRVLIATEDGSAGTKGNVIDAMRENDFTPDCIMACGPLPMLRALKKYAEEKKIPCFISMEERMACGVGACLGCIVKTTEKDAHSNVKNKRVCKDGPVFDAREVDLS